MPEVISLAERLQRPRKNWLSGLRPDVRIAKRPSWRLPTTTKKQAHDAIGHVSRQGWMLRAKELPCTDCGKPAYDYDHTHGYVFWWVVEPVCRKCHQSRECRRFNARYIGAIHGNHSGPKTNKCLA